MNGAALPESGYARPTGLVRSDGQIVVRTFPENGSAKRDFDFRKLQLGEEIELAIAEGFERAVGAGGTRHTKESITTLYGGIRAFAKLLNAESRPPRTLDELRPAHVAALRLRGTKYSSSIIMSIRIVLRSHGALPTPFRELLFAPMRAAQSANTVAAYSESEFRAIRRAARNEIKSALKRVRGLEAELFSWQQQSSNDVDPEVARRGNLLAFIVENEDVPRYKDGLVRRSPADKGSADLMRSLFPTHSELAAVVVLMACLTGQNLSTICARRPCLCFALGCAPLVPH